MRPQIIWTKCHISEGRGTGGAGNAADDSVTTALVVAGAGPDNDNEEEDAPPPALPPRPPNLALPAMQSAMSTSPAATSTASAASQHPPHIGNSYSRRLEDGAANRTGDFVAKCTAHHRSIQRGSDHRIPYLRKPNFNFGTKLKNPAPTRKVQWEPLFVS